VPAGREVDLEKWPTLVKPVYKSKKEYKKLLEKRRTTKALPRAHR
jgi:hypothetical protein